MADPESTFSMQGPSGQRQEEKRETVAQSGFFFSNSKLKCTILKLPLGCAKAKT